MIDAKFNLKNKTDYKAALWLCDSCESAIENQSHLMWCPAYQHVREGKEMSSDTDLVNYVRKVLQIRQELKLRR